MSTAAVAVGFSACLQPAPISKATASASSPVFRDQVLLHRSEVWFVFIPHINHHLFEITQSKKLAASLIHSMPPAIRT
jgi:hypothetical protein